MKISRDRFANDDDGQWKKLKILIDCNKWPSWVEECRFMDNKYRFNEGKFINFGTKWKMKQELWDFKFLIATFTEPHRFIDFTFVFNEVCECLEFYSLLFSIPRS